MQVNCFCDLYQKGGNECYHYFPLGLSLEDIIDFFQGVFEIAQALLECLEGTADQAVPSVIVSFIKLLPITGYEVSISVHCLSYLSHMSSLIFYL